MVEPIITRVERDVFMGLTRDADRAKFIQFFWKQRDPLPETAENEFQKEYADRIRFADLNFHSGTGKKGSRTERGYYYLLLGRPRERTVFSTQSQTWPAELWFYEGETQYGLPPYFYLVFFQDKGIGDYRLLSPSFDGPERLVIPSMMTDTLTRASAYKIVRNVSRELGEASLSYIPAGGRTDMASLGSETVIADVRSLANRKYSDAYARTFADYKDFVETDYSDKFVGAGALLKVYTNGRQPFLHWSIEPDRISFVEYQKTYTAAFEIILKLEDPSGKSILERTEEIPVKLSPEQYKAHERQHLAFQDLLPIIPGDYKMFVLLKNKSSKDFTSFHTRITVGPDSRELRAANLLLYHARDQASSAPGAPLRAFTFDGYQYLFNVRNEFLPQESLGGFFQIIDAGTASIPAGSEFRLELFAADKTVPAARRVVPWTGESGAVRNVDLGLIPLADVAPGYYRAEVSLVGGDGRTILSQKENFIVLASPYPTLPWVASKQHPAFPAAEHFVVLASQYFLAGDYSKAREYAESALGSKDSAGARLILGRALYALKEYGSSLKALLPVYETSKDREAGKVIALDYVGLSEWANALRYLEDLMLEATEVTVLNQAAECYVRLNQPEQAVPLLEKSLSLLPDQPAVRELLGRLKK